MMPDITRPPMDSNARKLRPSPKLKRILDVDQLKQRCLDLLDATDSQTLLENSVTDLESKLLKVTATEIGQ